MHTIMHPSQLLLLLSWLWPVDCSRTPSPSHHHTDRRSHPHTLTHPETIRKKQFRKTRSPKSVGDLGCIPTDGTPYTGHANTTESGLTCQMWSDDTPHEHSNTGVGEHNYCRSPDGDKIWCYTTDPEKQWEYCKVPFCMTYTKGINLE